MDKIFRALKRLVRGAASLLISGGLVYATKDAKMIMFAPIINAVAKFLRDKFGIKYMPV